MSDKYFHPASNYRVLIKRIEDESGGKACFVNFNYDLLLERHIPKINEARVVDEYMAGPTKVVKIHGSCNWFHDPIKVMTFSGMNDVGSYVYYVSQAEKFFENVPPLHAEVENKLRQFSASPGDGFMHYYLPAVTIPLSGKHGFICPNSHIEILKEELMFTDRILVIGWKAGDPSLLEILNNHSVSDKKKLFVVSADSDSAANVSTNFNDKIFDIYPCKSRGFSEFMSSKEFDDFWL